MAQARKNRFDLTGRVAIVTGAARGIGKALAIGLAEEGAAVVVNYAQAADRAAEVVREIEALGGAPSPSRRMSRTRRMSRA